MSFPQNHCTVLGAIHQSSALARLVTRRRLDDDVDSALAANHAVVAVAALARLERVLDLHCLARRWWPTPGPNIKGAPFRRAQSGPAHRRGAPAMSTWGPQG